MENYIIALVCYGLLFLVAHIYSRRKSTKKPEITDDNNNNKQNVKSIEEDTLEAKSVA